MKSPKRLAAVLVGVMAVSATAGEQRHRVGSNMRCGIPARDYQYHAWSPPVTGISQRAFPIPAEIGADADRAASEAMAASTAGKSLAARASSVTVPADAKGFQFPPVPVAIDHCAITDAGLVIFADGRYIIRFRAEQNPRILDAPEVTPVIPDDLRVAVRQTSHIKRNKFRVRVSLYGPTPNTPEGTPLLAGPMLLVLGEEELWVQNGQPVDRIIEGRDPRLAAVFPQAFRAGITLSYR